MANILEHDQENFEAKACLVMCSSQKINAAGAAKNLYVSRRFIDDVKIAEECYHNWRIISGKHGILSPDSQIDPYDIDLNKEVVPIFWTGGLGVISPFIKPPQAA